LVDAKYKVAAEGRGLEITAGTVPCGVAMTGLQPVGPNVYGSGSTKKPSWADLSEDIDFSDDTGEEFNFGFVALRQSVVGSAGAEENEEKSTSASSPLLHGEEKNEAYPLPLSMEPAVPALAAECWGWRAPDVETPSEDERHWQVASSGSASSSLRGEGPAPTVNGGTDAVERGPAWSVGSLAHASGDCRPCIFFPKSVGCDNGRDCLYCHCDDHTPRVRHRRHLQRRRRRRRPLGTMPEAGDEDDADGGNDGASTSFDSSAPSAQELSPSGRGRGNRHSEDDLRPQRTTATDCEQQPAGEETVKRRIAETLSTLFAPFLGTTAADEDRSPRIQGHGGGGDSPPPRLLRSVTARRAQAAVATAYPWQKEAQTPSDDERAWLGCGSRLSQRQ